MLRVVSSVRRETGTRVARANRLFVRNVFVFLFFLHFPFFFLFQVSKSEETKSVDSERVYTFYDDSDDSRASGVQASRGNTNCVQGTEIVRAIAIPTKSVPRVVAWYPSPVPIEPVPFPFSSLFTLLLLISLIYHNVVGFFSPSFRAVHDLFFTYSPARKPPSFCFAFTYTSI